MKNALQLSFALLLFTAGSFAADIKVLWKPESRLALVGVSAEILGDASVVSDMLSSGPFLGLPEGYIVLIAQAGEAALDQNGEISKTFFSTGAGKTDDPTVIVDAMGKAGISVSTLKGIILVTCFGGRTLSGESSLADRLSRKIGVPVLASSGQVVPCVILSPTGRGTLYKQVISFSVRTPSGPKRENPWTVFGDPNQVSSEQAAVLATARSDLQDMEDFASQRGLVPGDLRERPGSTAFPDLLGAVHGLRQQDLEKELRSLAPDLYRIKIAAMAVQSALYDHAPEKFEEQVFAAAAVAFEDGNGVMLPALSRSWYEGKHAGFVNRLSNKLRQIVFTPTPPENGLGLSDLEWAKAVDYSTWQVIRPRVTALSYFDEEIEAVKKRLEKSFGESKERPFTSLTCEGELQKKSRDRRSWWKR